MYLLIIALPLIGTIFSGLFGNKIGVVGAKLITVTSITLSFILSCFVFYEVALQGSPCYIEIFKWFDSEMISFSWGFLFDSLTVTMLIVVTSISTCVHIYSTEYMSTDPHIQRFMAYLSFFTFFMLILVTADNFFQMFLGWEGVGLCSYLLINFWFGRIQANKAALKAIIVNRIGDIGLALGIFTIYFVFNSIDYATVFALAPTFKNYYIIFFGFEINVLTLICVFFFIGATGKSAQVGLHTWLPDAMEGPTPVSALIHAATMVTAGIFLIVRCSPIFEYAPTVAIIISISGAMTAFIAASIGLVQNDLKRVIAYSTCSQLGYMMIACGTSGYAVGMFHLTNHAFFKALLFLSAGSIIHALSDEQDMRKMGGLLYILPFTYSMMFIGSLSLMGFPFLTGFYSKDLILEWTYSQYSINGTFAYWLGSISAFLTAFYSIRVLSLTFLKKPLMSRVNISHAHEPYYTMTGPLFFLSFCSIFIGYILKDMMVGFGTDFWGSAIFVLPENILLLEAEFLETKIKIFPVLLSLCGGSVAFLFYNFFFKLLVTLKLSFIGKKFYTFFNRKWFFDKIYNEILTQYTLTTAYEQGYQNIDRGIIELIGPNGIWQLFAPISNKLNFTFNFYLDTPKKLRSFFKILFITFIFVYLFIFGTWYLNAYEIYFQTFFKGYFSYEKSNLNDFVNYYSEFSNSKFPDSFDPGFPVDEKISKRGSYIIRLIPDIFNEDFLKKIADALNIRKGPFDKQMNPLPYLPIDERWIPDLDKFLSNAAILEGDHLGAGISTYTPKSTPPVASPPQNSGIAEYPDYSDFFKNSDIAKPSSTTPSSPKNLGIPEYPDYSDFVKPSTSTPSSFKAPEPDAPGVSIAPSGVEHPPVPPEYPPAPPEYPEATKKLVRDKEFYKQLDCLSDHGLGDAFYCDGDCGWNILAEPSEASEKFLKKALKRDEICSNAETYWKERGCYMKKDFEKCSLRCAYCWERGQGIVFGEKSKDDGSGGDDWWY